ncbi:MAG: hypothetical protein LGB68_01705 [Sulfurovum sp.]|nr:hypothetical protein [Sulfurovum sp.]
MTLNEFVNEIYASHKRDKDTNYVFLLGVEYSKSSGIPLTRELAIGWFFELTKETYKFKDFINKHVEQEEIKEEALAVPTKDNISNELSSTIAKRYFQLFEALFPDMIDRQKEIQRLTEEKYLGLGYYNLADLMKCKAFNVVVTTNFDDLVHDALLYNGQSKRARVISRHLGSGTGLF